jgi:hypothetical protein
VEMLVAVVTEVAMAEVVIKLTRKELDS